MNRSTRHSRTVLGSSGAVSAGSPLAASAATATLAKGGNALDAAIAAQAVICVTMPQAAGLGGDMLALVHSDGTTTSFNGTGKSPSVAPSSYATDGGSSVTVPGMVDGWTTAHQAYGGLPMSAVLAPAIRIASEGFSIDAPLARAVAKQRSRISQYGADAWALLRLEEGRLWRQPELASLLNDIAEGGRAGFYTGSAARAICTAVASHGGTLSVSDLDGHSTDVLAPVQTSWAGARLHVQPPSTQGTLLAMAARWLDAATGVTGSNLQHVLTEVTEAAFAHRDSAGRGASLLAERLEVDLERAQNRGGPRSYLHTAGVAVADSHGMVVSSLISVFDDFGSGVHVPELGLVLNNRAGGFTSGENSPGPARRPVHTLAPALLVKPNGDVLALATPGADGQIQTLLQVLARMRFNSDPLESAIAAPRWRSQDGQLLIEEDHEGRHDLLERGHRLAERRAGDDLFGAVVAAGVASGRPYAASDWRRNVTTGAV
jgi:gamma-glutamyltranspeptidase/glutathione hydrolase